VTSDIIAAPVERVHTRHYISLRNLRAGNAANSAMLPAATFGISSRESSPIWLRTIQPGFLQVDADMIMLACQNQFEFRSNTIIVFAN
jgi:hypothetical protein